MTKADWLIQCASWFGGGAILVLVAMGGLNGLITSTVFKSVFDSTAFWTALGSLAVISGVVVAIFQLAALNRHTMIRNTIEQIRNFYLQRLDDSHTTLLHTMEDQLHEMRRAGGEAFEKRCGDITEVYNYFALSTLLLEEKAIDAKTFLRHFGGALREADHYGGGALKFISQWRQGGQPMRAIHELAKRSEKYRR